MKKVKRKLKILKNRIIKKKLKNFFGWIKGSELIELESCNTNEIYLQANRIYAKSN